jgi:hypothetical protein
MAQVGSLSHAQAVAIDRSRRVNQP